MGIENLYILVLEYRKCWDRGDFEHCNLPILVTADLKKAVAFANNIQKEMVQEEMDNSGSSDSVKIVAYKLGLDKELQLNRVSNTDYYDTPLVFTLEYYSLVGGGDQGDIEWEDEEEKKAYEAKPIAD